MKVFSALVGELKGVLGKGFVLAGILPAAVFTVGFRWFAERESLAETFEGLSPLVGEEPGEGLNLLISFGLLTLLLGLVFFAGRSAILDFVQRLPGRPLRWLRELLQRRQAIALQKALHRTEQLNHGLTVLRWMKEGKFDRPGYLPAVRKALEPAEMTAKSAAGRGAFEGCLPASGCALTPPKNGPAERMVDGMLVLYENAFDDKLTTEFSEEFGLWKELLQRERAEQVLALLQGHVQRQWAIPRERFEDFPEDAYILPTTLGTRAAALDDYARKRYGIGTSTLLSRLWPVLEDTERDGLANTRLSLEMTVNLGASFALLASATLAHNLYHAWPWKLPAGTSLAALTAAIDQRTVLFVVVPLLLAGLLYRAAIFTYGALEEKVLRAIDLQRLALIEKLGFVRPTSVGEERETWEELNGFFVDGVGLDSQRPLNPKA